MGWFSSNWFSSALGVPGTFPAKTINITWADTTSIQNITFAKGEDVTLAFAPAAGQTPTDITAQTWKLTVRFGYGGPVILTKTLGAGLTIINLAAGTLNGVISDADTTGLAPAQYVYDLQRIDTGNICVRTAGTLTLNPEVRI